MKKIVRAILLIVLFFLVGCDPKVDPQYELDLSSIEEQMDIKDFEISLIRIKEIVGDKIYVINCDETMFSEEDYKKLQTPGTHTVKVIYKLFTGEFTITLYDNSFIDEETFIYEIDVQNVSNIMYIDDFDLSLIKIKKTSSKGTVEYIECDKNMISEDDYNKLFVVGEHSIVIFYEENQFEVKITLIERTSPEQYTYELDLGYLRDENLIDDFNLNMIIIKEISSTGEIKYIECKSSMLSQADNNKLLTPGTHTITVNYKQFSAEVTITLIDLNSGNTDPKDVFNSNLSYYSSANGLKGTELKMSLRTIITSTHKKVTTYAELKTYLQKADEDPNNSKNMILFYTGTSVAKTSNMNVWNREHVWAQSLTGGWFGTSGAGADMHHIRPCNPSENSSRGNKKFGTASGYYDPSAHGGDFRGDVARIIFYLFTRYTESDKHTFKSIAQSKELLLEWNKLDPVSETEIIRNDYTQTIQGNRNPFIDHPECADLIWGSVSTLNNSDIEFYSIETIFYIEDKRKYDFI